VKRNLITGSASPIAYDNKIIQRFLKKLHAHCITWLFKIAYTAMHSAVK
jgi:hypothetical protein